MSQETSWSPIITVVIFRVLCIINEYFLMHITGSVLICIMIPQSGRTSWKQRFHEQGREVWIIASLIKCINFRAGGRHLSSLRCGFEMLTRLHQMSLMLAPHTSTCACGTLLLNLNEKLFGELDEFISADVSESKYCCLPPWGAHRSSLIFNPRKTRKRSYYSLKFSI